MEIQKLSSEEIAKILSLYFPCKIINGVDGDLKERDLSYKNLESCAYTRVGEPKMLLSRLEDITDEDAVQVKKLQDCENKKSKIKLMMLDGLFRIDCGCSNCPFLVEWETRDFLISKGYAVPLWFGIDHWANGKTAIELGIAIDKNKKG